ncbi:MAG: S9 family peptidase, partial [Bacteroidales bacterium]|nr:S9 family peptidase [Bacteroidales bacterium]
MKNTLIIAVSIIAIIGTACKQATKLNYPQTKKTDVVDTYFGTEVADPYRWLEDDHSEETQAWVASQMEVTEGYLSKLSSREAIKSRLTNIWDYPKVSAPFKSGGVWFKFKNEGLQAQSVLYKLDSPEDEGTIFLDPNKLSEDGTVSLGTFKVSDDGKYFAYSISRGGSDWNEFFVKEIAGGNELQDHIQWVKFSGIAWHKDGFYYGRYPKPENNDVLKGENKNSKIYYHKIGTPQSEDQLFYEDPIHPDWGFGAYLTEDRNYMVISVTESTSGNALYIKDMQSSQLPIVKIVENFEKDHWILDHHKGKLLVMTNWQAPNYRLMAIDPQNPSIENWINIIPEKTNVLKGVSITGNKLIASYLQDARSKVEVYDMQGSYLHDI